MNNNIFENGDIYCVSCGNPMTSEMGSMICPECQKYLNKYQSETPLALADGMNGRLDK